MLSVGECECQLFVFFFLCFCVFFQAEDGIRDLVRSRGLGDVYKRQPIFSFVEGDGRNLSNFGDKTFDIAHSNSVLEHVGNWEDMHRFAGEIARVGRKYFVQTPSFWFPVAVSYTHLTLPTSDLV